MKPGIEECLERMLLLYVGKRGKRCICIRSQSDDNETSWRMPCKSGLTVAMVCTESRALHFPHITGAISSALHVSTFKTIRAFQAQLWHMGDIPAQF